MSTRGVGTGHIMVITRYPEAGKVKTRLIPSIGEQAAAQVMHGMGAHVAEMVREASALSLNGMVTTADREEVTAEGLIHGGTLTDAEKWLGLHCVAQVEGDLGDKLRGGMASAFARGAEVAAIVGGDCPEITPILINRALVAAKTARGGSLVTASDGGYCLIALHRDASHQLDEIFNNIEWSTEKVAAQQSACITQAGFSCTTVAEISDVDTPEDLPLWESIEIEKSALIKSFSIIVPTLDEEAVLERNLHAMRSYVTSILAEHNSELSAGESSDILEVDIIVADGGSTDATIAIAEKQGARVIKSKKGRAVQMNAAAASSSADALFFFHADTRPMARAEIYGNGATANRAQDNPLNRLVCGHSSARVVSLTFGFEQEPTNLQDRLALSLFEFFTRLRPLFGGLPYGDQGFCCKRSYFEGMGGFPELEILEDFEFSRRTKAGGRGHLQISKDVACTSPRRYLVNGPFRTMLLHRRIISAYLRGASASELAELRATANQAYSNR